MDCTFLETQGIMDYSLLLGVHFRNDLSVSKIGLSQPIALTSKLNMSLRILTTMNYEFPHNLP
jgi:hypothetical protein